MSRPFRSLSDRLVLQPEAPRAVKPPAEHGRHGSTLSQRALARQYGVSRSAIVFVQKGKTWCHVGTPEKAVAHSRELAELCDARITIKDGQVSYG